MTDELVRLQKRGKTAGGEKWRKRRKSERRSGERREDEGDNEG